jgi:hypothetical protein
MKVRVYLDKQLAVGKQHGHVRITPSSTRPRELG